MKRRILVVDDDTDVLAGLGALLAHTEWDVATASSAREAFRQFESFAPDVVLLDVMLPDMSGIEVLDHIKAVSEITPVIMMSGVGTVDIAVQAMRLGAESFVPKPCDIDNLELVLEQAMKQVRLQRELTALRRSSRVEKKFPGTSKVAEEINIWIDRVASAPSPVLLLGESGTGKGFVARMIHARSQRSREPFVDLNCAGLSRTLLESELFGHEKGAFTDASSAKQGLFEIAGQGTVFLDEIGEMEPSVQARLLKALEDKKFRRVGGVRDLQAGFRLLAATNRRLEEEVAAGRFRKDLFYRLNVVAIQIPPLRDRLEDIPILAAALFQQLLEEIPSTASKVSERALARLSKHSWPGNVRELRNVLERGLLMSKGTELKTEDLLLENSANVASSTGVPVHEWQIEPLEKMITEYVRGAVEAAGGNVRNAARRLGISPTTLYARLKERPTES